MKEEDNYLEINRPSWNNKTETQLKSEFYSREFFTGEKFIEFHRNGFTGRY